MSRASEQVSARLCIFARAPELGRVKTRLADGIGAAPALAAHEELVEGCLSRLASLAALRSTLWIAGPLPLAQHTSYLPTTVTVLCLLTLHPQHKPPKV